MTEPLDFKWGPIAGWRAGAWDIGIISPHADNSQLPMYAGARNTETGEYVLGLPYKNEEGVAMVLVYNINRADFVKDGEVPVELVKRLGQVTHQFYAALISEGRVHVEQVGPGKSLQSILDATVLTDLIPSAGIDAEVAKFAAELERELGASHTDRHNRRPGDEERGR